MNKVKRLLTAVAFAITLSAPQWAIAEAIVVLKAEQAMFATQKAIVLGQQLSAQLGWRSVRTLLPIVQLWSGRLVSTLQGRYQCGAETCLACPWIPLCLE